MPMDYFVEVLEDRRSTLSSLVSDVRSADGEKAVRKSHDYIRKYAWDFMGRDCGRSAVRGHEKVPGCGHLRSPLVATKVPAFGHEKSPPLTEVST